MESSSVRLLSFFSLPLASILVGVEAQRCCHSYVLTSRDTHHSELANIFRFSFLSLLYSKFNPFSVSLSHSPFRGKEERKNTGINIQSDRKTIFNIGLFGLRTF